MTIPYTSGLPLQSSETMMVSMSLACQVTNYARNDTWVIYSDPAGTGPAGPTGRYTNARNNPNSAGMADGSKRKRDGKRANEATDSPPSGKKRANEAKPVDPGGRESRER